MRVFKTKTFERWAGKAGVTDGVLLNAVAQMERGLIDADLGGNLFKQRVALPGRGKSGNELETFKLVAGVLLGLDVPALAKALERGELKELSHEKTND